MFDEFVNIVRHPTIWHVETGAMARVLKDVCANINQIILPFFYIAFCKMQIEYYMMHKCIFYRACRFDLNNQRFDWGELF